MVEVDRTNFGKGSRIFEVDEVDHRTDEIVKAMITWFQTAKQLHSPQAIAIDTRTSASRALVAVITTSVHIAAGIGATACVRAATVTAIRTAEVVAEESECVCRATAGNYQDDRADDRCKVLCHP